MSPFRRSLLVLPTLVLVLGANACQRTKGREDPPPPPTADAATLTKVASDDSAPNRKPLTAFASDDDIKAYYSDYQETLKKRQEEAQRKQQELIQKAAALQNGQANKPSQATPAGMPPSAPMASPLAAGKGASAAEPKPDSVARAGKADGKEEGITNNQTAGVDEGGIVKVHGDHLVILRRGRLFTVKVDGKNLLPIAAVDAFGPAIAPQGTWYDEMLISGNTLVVIGYSYARGGTEVGVFDLDAAGKIAYRATYHLRGNDYYSARNYASRVVGQKLVFYTPSYLSSGGQDFFGRFPAVRKWHSGATPAEFKRVVEPTRVFKPAFDLAPQALHTVTTCDLASADLSCKATSILGPAGRVFYVSETAVYVWMSEHSWDGEKSTQVSAVVKLPLDGSAPGAVKVSGGPIDQFSFLEDEKSLNVFVRAETTGEGMWGSTFSSGDVAMVRLPLGFFSEGSVESSPKHYTKLSAPKGYSIQNRFVGSHFLYGVQSYGQYRSPGAAQNDGAQTVFAYKYSGGKEATAVEIGHSVDRLEALGTNAIVVGSRDRDLQFSSLSLVDTPKVASVYVRKGATQAEQRSHGFFYKPETEDSGLLGLPVLGAPVSHGDDDREDEGSAKVLFLKNQALDLKPVGELASSRSGPANDACRASCVDWYGNARPIFMRGRIFALMGYEIVEGSMDGGRIHEVRRTSFAPKAHGRPAED